MEVVDIQEQPCKFPQVGNGRNHSNNLMNKEIAHSPDSEEEEEEEDENKQLSKRVTLVYPAGEEADPAAGDGANLHHRWRHSSRIIRVSRATGGKDRHSKVWTSKGLRDRRVRLSVGTAIQFYDLQDRLGFDQPSKAVEWLIEAASDAIAELPSLRGLDLPEEVKEKQLPDNPSFTELLTGAATSAPANAVVEPDYFASSSRLGHIQSAGFLGRIQQDRVQHFSIGPENLNDSNLNFTISSGVAGCNRGTLQSNISAALVPYRQLHGSNAPFFIGAASPPATAPVRLENHHPLTPALFDGSWQLHHSDQKGKGKN